MMLTAERLRQVLHYDPQTGVFTRISGYRPGKRIGKKAGTRHSRGYWWIGVDGRQYLAHRLAWLYVHGEWPKGKLDHKDRNKQHNWIDNLRPATESQNLANSGPTKKSQTGVRGVFRHPNGRFRAQISANHKMHSLGYFDTIDEAGAAYRAKAIELYGEFAVAA